MISQLVTGAMLRDEAVLIDGFGQIPGERRRQVHPEWGLFWRARQDVVSEERPTFYGTLPTGGNMSELSDIIDALKPVSTATIATALLNRGLRRVWMRGTRPIRPGQPRTVGRAFTLRFIPAREDLATPASWSSPRSTRAAIEEMTPGGVAVADAMGVTDAGIFGDILCARMKQRGVAGLITDGAMRDMAGVLKTGLSVWCGGAAAPPSVASLTFVNWQEPIGCGGVSVYPDDVVVADDDGAVLIPAALVEEVARVAQEQELIETWIMDEVLKGARLPGLYPPNEDNLKRYKDWASRR